MRRIVRSLLLAGLLAGLPALSSAQPPGRAPAAQEEYVPIAELDQVEQLPAAPLLITAYAIIWVGAFVYLWSLSRRLAGVDRELAALRRRLQDRGPADTGRP